MKKLAPMGACLALAACAQVPTMGATPGPLPTSTLDLASACASAWSDACAQAAMLVTSDPTPAWAFKPASPSDPWIMLEHGHVVALPYVMPELGDALAESGDVEDAPTRNWLECGVSVDDTTYVVCPDGLVVSS